MSGLKQYATGFGLGALTPNDEGKSIMEFLPEVAL